MSLQFIILQKQKMNDAGKKIVKFVSRTFRENVQVEKNMYTKEMERNKR